MRKYQKVVDAGVALLDKKKPTWRKQINPEILDMSRFNRCILGQLYGEYAIGLMMMENKFPYLANTVHWEQNYGFYLLDDSWSCTNYFKALKLLANEWRRRL